MFCPVCKYEFRCGFTRCNTCDVDLVDALPPEEEVDHTPKTPAAEMEQPTLLWRGANGGIFSALTLALDDAHIKFNREELDARLIFSSQHTDLEVWVPAADLSAAQQVLDAVLANPVNATAAHDRYVPTASDAEAGDETDEGLPDESDEGPDDVRHESVARELYAEDATAEIWSGDNETMAEVLKSCLAEVGVNCYVHRPDSDANSESHSVAHSNASESNGGLQPARAGGPGAPLPFAVRVLPADEKRARQIVREVTDAVPPQ